ncbi:MAG TPA: SRPBCC family protein [Xanthobacteraceae bacterium]|nr:SRPBCC family protein [Xanthobacteraceae bacterium]
MTLLPRLLIAGLLSCAAVPAFAVEVTKSIEVAAPPAATWAAIGKFCGIGLWHPAVQTCTLGMKPGHQLRTLALKGGGTILEEETARNEAAMSYSYIILESPLPVADYKSTITVKPHGAGSTIVWNGDFKAKDAPDAKAAEVIGGIYTAGLDALKAKLK